VAGGIVNLHTHVKYRADIDGLRAIAVLSVVGFHAFPFWIKGGFIGVDIFFVISGFLISINIIGSLERNSFSFIEFYSRRIKRIFPALLLVLIVCFVFGWFALLADEYKQLGKHIAGGTFFVSNFLFWNESGYFDNAAETKPLLHLWSLGIEEQFYIVWPLLLWLAWKKRFSLLTITIAVAIISFALNISKMHSDAVAAFYSPQTRIWELLAGSVLAHMTLHKKNIFPKFKQRLDTWLGLIDCAQAPEANSNTLRNVYSVFGAVLIAIGILVITKEKHFPGWWAMLPTVGAVLIISAGTQAWLNRAVLSNRVLVWFGLISYPLYLWHWPLLSFARIYSEHMPPLELRIALVVLSVVLAWMTYHFIEKPIRFDSNSKVWLLVALMAGMGAIGVYVYTHNGIGWRTPKFIEELSRSNYDVKAGWREHECYLPTEDDSSKFAELCIEKDKRPLVFLWGDSYAAALYPGLKSLQKSYSFAIAQHTASACAPLLGWQNPDRKFCKNINDTNIALIAKIKPDIVLLHSNWFAEYVPGYREGKEIYYDISKLEVTVSELKKLGLRNIILIGPPPQWQDSLSKQLVNHWKNNLQIGVPPVRLRVGLVDSIPALDVRMESLSKQLGVHYISAYLAMCNKEGCLTRRTLEDTGITTFDNGHFSEHGSVMLFEKIGEQLANLGGLSPIQ
jgi:peptidoglycan/LPS O-acetylase OafA/YrhL